MTCLDADCSACANIHISMIRCFLNCCCPTLSCLFCIDFVIERKEHSIYLHNHLNATLSSVGMFNGKPLLAYIELLFTLKRRMKNNFAVSISGAFTYVYMGFRTYTAAQPPDGDHNIFPPLFRMCEAHLSRLCLHFS